MDGIAPGIMEPAVGKTTMFVVVDLVIGTKIKKKQKSVLDLMNITIR
jgi:hypothetical protein